MVLFNQGWWWSRWWKWFWDLMIMIMIMMNMMINDDDLDGLWWWCLVKMLEFFDDDCDDWFMMIDEMMMIVKMNMGILILLMIRSRWKWWWLFDGDGEDDCCWWMILQPCDEDHIYSVDDGSWDEDCCGGEGEIEKMKLNRGICVATMSLWRRRREFRGRGERKMPDCLCLFHFAFIWMGWGVRDVDFWRWNMCTGFVPKCSFVWYPGVLIWWV